MNFILTNRMFYVIIFNLLRPTVVEMVNFTGDFFATFQVESFVDFGITTLS